MQSNHSSADNYGSKLDVEAIALYFPYPKESAIALPYPSVPKYFWQNPNNLRFVKFSEDQVTFCIKVAPPSR
ncbi:hypothetical protein [Tychonema sp. LEGE 07196]|uniref:hypothetical protein n=1 Tax=Tychonema sp. LEGE 07196 TaxID=1828665 RepID=UPI0019E73719|nr:hypothetical protein [Tychonema sp. LEGE 07196]